MPPLDELYFKWLYSLVASTRLKNPSRTHWRLLKLLYTKEFYWFLPNDDNRVEDGRDLRMEFAQRKRIELDSEWVGLECSVLEMMIGLSRRLAFESEQEWESRDWFWHLIENLNLRRFNDRHISFSDEEEIDHILERMIWRLYEGDGRGGLFPLENPPEDQRKVELWYQLSYYLMEQET